MPITTLKFSKKPGWVMTSEREELDKVSSIFTHLYFQSTHDDLS